MLQKTLKQIEIIIKNSFTDKIIKSHIKLQELCMYIHPQYLLEIITYLRDASDLRFKQLTDLCAVDYLHRDPRFEIVYHLLSYKFNQRLRIKIAVAENEIVDSVAKIYNSAGWYEREAWDMFGIPFRGNNDMRRLLTDYNFAGFPLRKDFPLVGYIEPHYSKEQQKIVSEKVKLPQEYREFDFISPWQGENIILPGDEKANKES